jgi:transcriptional regulator with XRE-family HTH domain
VASQAQALRICRAARSLLQRDVAARARVDVSYISLLEAGRRDASEPTLQAILAVLRVQRSTFDALASGSLSPQGALLALLDLVGGEG